MEYLATLVCDVEVESLWEETEAETEAALCGRTTEGDFFSSYPLEEERLAVERLLEAED
jgi:hypothetical protein